VFLAAQVRPATDGDDKAAAAPDAVFRVGAEDAAAVATQGSGLIGQPDLTPDGRWLLAGVIAADGSVRLLSTAADARPGQPRSVSLLGPTPRPSPASLSPRLRPSVRVQP
jgi:hypothetical protein